MSAHSDGPWQLVERKRRLGNDYKPGWHIACETHVVIRNVSEPTGRQIIDAANPLLGSAVELAEAVVAHFHGTNAPLERMAIDLLRNIRCAG